MLDKLSQIVLICAMLVLPLTTASPVKADVSFDLIINEGVIVPWDICNIAPGSHGAFGVDIRNAGTMNGYLAVWINGIIDNEGDNPESETGDTEEPGELSQYLTLSIWGTNISPYAESPHFTLPVTLSQFPGTSLSPLMLHDQLLEPGVTIHVQWEWAIPPQTTNVIQGDSVSFNIHYLLTPELLIKKPIIPGSGGGSSWKFDTDADTQEDDTDEVTVDTKDSDVETDSSRTDVSGNTTETDITDAFVEVIPSITDESIQPSLTDPEDSQRKIDLGDISSTLGATPYKILSQVSLIVAIIGALIMIILAVILRKRRKRKHAAKG